MIAANARRGSRRGACLARAMLLPFRMSSLYACSLGLGCTLVLLGCSASPPGGADGDSTAAGGSSSGTTTGAPTTEPEIPTTSASTSDPDTTGSTGTTDTTGSTGSTDTTSASTTTAPGSTTLDDDTSSGTGTTAAAVCGDGVVDLGEACDDGNLNDEDACASDCSQAFAVEEMVAGHFHVCVRITGGRVKCWGDNPFGQLGLGDSENRGDEPGEMGAALPYVDLGAGNVVVQLSLGQYHSCARFTDGRVKCWGENYDGKLGLGDIEHRGDEPGEMGDALPFVDLGAGAKVLHLAASGPQTCALLDVGRVKCWGSGINGVLGNGNTLNVGDEPGEMGDALPFIDLGPFEVSSLWKGDAGACAALTAGGVKCWAAGRSPASATPRPAATSPARWASTSPKCSSAWSSR